MRGLDNLDKQRILNDFHDFLEVDLRLAKSTIRDHLRCIDVFLTTLNKEPEYTSKNEIRAFLKTNGNCHYVKAIRVFFGKYLNKANLISTFKIPSSPFKPKYVPYKDELAQYYDRLDKPRDRVIFLLLATSGLRFHEVMELRRCDIDVEKQLIKPLIDNSSSKRAWCSFFNLEAKDELMKYLTTNQFRGNERLFSKAKEPSRIRVFNNARKMYPHITPKTLRQWFCCEMARLGTQDRYVDAFTGRTPKSILARHYTDFSPRRLKEIYDNAGLTVFH